MALVTGGWTKAETKNRNSVNFSKKRQVYLHITRIGIIVLNLALGNNIGYKFMGKVCKLFFGGGIKSGFLLYPANAKYSSAYVYDWYKKQMKWKPRLVGFIIQFGKFKPYFGISASNEDIWEDAKFGCKNLKKVFKRMEQIRNLLGAEYMTYAGIIPGVATKAGLMLYSPEAEITVPGVILALDKLKRAENIDDEVELVVVGGEGYIGKKLISTLCNTKGVYPVCVDIKNGTNGNSWPVKTNGKTVVVINVARDNVLHKYISSMRPGTIVLNEVYPPPGRKVLTALEDIGVKCYHLKGAPGFAWRKFPGAYKGVIPLCASHQPKTDSKYKFDVVIEKITQ